jgi:hypothetical protein
MVAEIRYVHRERLGVAIARYDTPLPAMRRFDAIGTRQKNGKKRAGPTAGWVVGYG